MIDINDIDWSKFVLVKSGKMLKVMYDKEGLQFCTSTLYSPFGVKSFMKTWSPFASYTMDCYVNNGENEVFDNFFIKLEETIEKLVKEYDETSQLEYQPIMRQNGSYPKLLKIQLPRDKNGNFECFVFDQDKKSIKVNDSNIEEVLCKKTSFKTIVKCSKVWIYNGKVGTTWDLVQLKVSPKVQETVNVEKSEFEEFAILD